MAWRFALAIGFCLASHYGEICRHYYGASCAAAGVGLPAAGLLDVELMMPMICLPRVPQSHYGVRRRFGQRCYKRVFATIFLRSQITENISHSPFTRSMMDCDLALSRVDSLS